MNANDAGKFAELIAALATSFNREADRPMLMGYKMGLEDLSINDIAKAIARAIRECKFMPKPAELRELAGAINWKQRAILAWDALDAAVVAHGYYRSVDFDDPVINATVRNMGGWQAVCDKPADEWQTFFRNNFERIYLLLCATGVSKEQAAPLTGHYASINGPAGHQVESPVRIATGLSMLPQIERTSVAQVLLEAGR